VQKFLGVWQNELLVACSNGLLLSLDVESGKLLHEWHSLPGYMQEIHYFANLMPDGQNLVLDEARGMLIGIHVYTYFEIDLKTREVHQYDLREEMPAFGITEFKPCRSNPFTDTHIFVTAFMKKQEDNPNWSYDCLVALNRSSHKIDWQYKFEGESLGTNIPQLGGNRLYQLDNGKTLHVFEKEVN
jgi:hypothetical protein